jgi:hypothetical protein
LASVVIAAPLVQLNNEACKYHIFIIDVWQHVKAYVSLVKAREPQFQVG